MIHGKDFDVIIIGGSYAGLSAAMSLGRSLRHVLVIDSGLPCNAPTPHSHNFITHDGEVPLVIANKAKLQVLQYETVQFLSALATAVQKTDLGFVVGVSSGDVFHTRKIVFATGLKDIIPDIKGFAACWGKSVLHCPYCHGYEVKHEKTGIIANGDMGFEFARLISNWTSQLILFTNGKAGLSKEQFEKLNEHRVPVIETAIDSIEHAGGRIENIVLADGSRHSLSALYARPAFTQHCPLPEELGCELTEMGLLKIDIFQRTTIKSVYACGDNSSPARSVSMAVAAGTMAGASLNKELIEESF